MKFLISFFLCSLISAYVNAGPSNVVDDGKSCVILSPGKCPKKSCECKDYITFNPKSWYRAFLSSFKGKKCKCDKCKQIKKDVICKHGTCDKPNQKCNCEYCWVGEICDKFENKHAPEFEDTQQEITITKSHPIELSVTKVSAFDRDLSHCNGADCPCGDIQYKLENDFRIFKVNKFTGDISLTKLPTKTEYVLKVFASNDPTFSDAQKSEMKVTVKIEDDGSKDEKLQSQINWQGDDESSEDNSARTPHVRRRRAITTGNDLVTVTAVPELTTTYYFNKEEKVIFKITLLNNDTVSHNNIQVKITSPLLEFELANISVGMAANKQFKSKNIETKDGKKTATFASSDTLSSKQSLVGALHCKVKDTLTPLANLELLMDVTYDSALEIQGFKSSPTIYGVFPEINVTTTSAAATYEDIDVTMSMQLPLLNYPLLIELTTNVECFVFMDVKNIQVAKGSGINFDGSDVATYHTSLKSNGLNDRAVINLGNLTVSGSKSDRTIEIKYKIGVKDHANVANGSIHYAGAGLQAGPSILWVEQQAIEVSKIEPALGVSYNKTVLEILPRLYYDSPVDIEYRVDHASTSEEEAEYIEVTLISPYLSSRNTLSGGSNGTHHSMAIEAMLKRGMILKGTFAMKVNDKVSPLMSIPAQLYVKYKNKLKKAKFPLLLNVTLPLVGTPSMTFSRIGSTGSIKFGQKLEFELIILLTKMNSSMQIEIVCPKHGNGTNSNGTAVMQILSIAYEVGSNIKQSGTTNAVIKNLPRYFNTSDDKESNDQAVIDLGKVANTASDVKNTSVNQIKVKVTVLVNEVANLTNGAIFKVGAGVIGMPRMVWVGQIDTTVEIASNDQPKLELNHTIIGETKDTYEHSIQFKHAPDSNQYAHSLVFEYYLPPFVQFIKEVASVPNVKQVSGVSRPRFQLTKPLRFLDSLNHSIEVKLKREFSPRTGVFDYMVPCAVTYVNYEQKRWQYWRSAKRSIHVKSRAPTIPKRTNAHSNYYGRGMYINKIKGEVYVCMNMHLPTARPACYLSKDNGDSWIALDSRVGCVIGHYSGDLYAVGRNQRVVIKYSPKDEDWVLLNEKTKKIMATLFATKQYKDYTDVDTLEPADIKAEHMPDDDKKWGVTDEGVFYRPGTASTWVKRAKWRL